MPKVYVIRGAIIKCSCGSMKSRIMIPVSHGVYAAGQPKLNINDYKEGKNITHFGFCTKTCDGDSREKGYDSKGNLVRRCKAKITGPWQGGQDNDLIENVSGLTNNCVTYCSYGGEITIEHHEQAPE